MDLDSLYGSRESGSGSSTEIHHRALIAEALALLDENTRRLVMMRLMDLEWSEIGDELDERPGTLKERFRVALRRLRERLSRENSAGRGGLEL
jgi:DNA-directed RNA polymerase specialized sigma24 family protein